MDWRECFKELHELREAVRASGKPTEAPPIPDPTESLVDCSKVYVKDHPNGGGVRAFAAVPIKEGELVELGVMRRVPVDGSTCELVFTWAQDGSCMATGSGCSAFYGPGLRGGANCRVTHFFDEDRFEIYAERQIAQDEELTHLYLGLEWRSCFSEHNK